MRAKALARPGKILVVMLRRIGDVLLTVPAARALKRLYPESRVDFLVEAPGHEVLEGRPDLGRVVRYDGSLARGLGLPLARRLARERYDWVVDYMGNPRSALLSFLTRAPLRAGPAHASHRWAYTHKLEQSSETCYSALEKIRVLRSLGLEPDETDPLPDLYLSPAARAFAERALGTLGPEGPFIGLVPASRRETRRWPAAHFASLARMLRERLKARVLVFWGPGERTLAESVRSAAGEDARLAPQTEHLQELAALLSRCRMVVSNCNGPRHIAVACRVPTLTVHGSSDPRAWNPPDLDRYPFVRREELFCIGCRKNACPYALECLRELPPERVFQEALALWERIQAAASGARAGAS